MNDYGHLARLLHHLMLDSRIVRQFTYEIDQLVGEVIASRDSNVSAGAGQHVFICGLARAGTSILLQTLHDSGEFRSLTYRDMPFVLAPRLWSKTKLRRGVPASNRERAHADGLTVSFDSPEAFEEVFWMTFSGEHYLRPDHLKDHEADEQLLTLFRRYIAAILAPVLRGKNTRYLSKNNNNILRLTTLRRAFPDATILIPFRHPIDHAQSLCHQHHLFCKLHEKDKFALRYMSWLGHYEFGLDHRPLKFSNSTASHDQGDSGDLPTYWLKYWTVIYEAVLANTGANTYIINYDELCSSPHDILGHLGTHLNLDGTLQGSTIGAHKATSYAPIEGVDQDWVQRATEIHSELCKHSHMNFPIC